ncbi:MAG: hypothetical protein NVS3B26_27970 [Mycobacteriales bacterium]
MTTGCLGARGTEHNRRPGRHAELGVPLRMLSPEGQVWARRLIADAGRNGAVPASLAS